MLSKMDGGLSVSTIPSPYAYGAGYPAPPYHRLQPWTRNMGDCRCFNCLYDQFDPNTGLRLTLTRMVLCETCGNKRCPHATDHRFTCTGSNEPGQPGSRYAVPQTPTVSGEHG